MTQMTDALYEKLFICQITGNVNFNEEISSFSSMKASVLGTVTAIKKFSSKTVYTVDDGTGCIDCVFWHNEFDSKKGTYEPIPDINTKLMPESESSAVNLFLSKIKKNEDIKVEYTHGEMMGCYGTVKLLRGKLSLYIKHHYKCNNVNAETLWIFNVLSLQKNK